MADAVKLDLLKKVDVDKLTKGAQALVAGLQYAQYAQMVMDNLWQAQNRLSTIQKDLDEGETSLTTMRGEIDSTQKALAVVQADLEAKAEEVENYPAQAKVVWAKIMEAFYPELEEAHRDLAFAQQTAENAYADEITAQEQRLYEATKQADAAEARLAGLNEALQAAVGTAQSAIQPSA